MDTEDDALAVGGQVVIIDGRIEVAKLGQSLLGLGDDLERQRLHLPAGDIELPDAEVVLENDGLTVTAHPREADVAGREVGDLLGLRAVTGAPDVGLTFAFPVAHEIDESVLAPERPGVHALEFGHVFEGLRGQIHDGDIALIGATVILSPVGLGFAGDG